MAKKLTIEVTPAQARALVWAINTFEAAYEGTEDWDKDAQRAVRTLGNLYNSVADYSESVSA